MTTRRSCRAGAVAPLVAFCLVALIGFVAIAVDGGVLLDRRQTLQAAADAAALAAAQDLYANYLTNQGQDQNGTALQAALDNASDNGYPSGNVTVNIPPTSGPFKDLVGYAEVIVTYDQQRYFSALFGKSKIQLTARAVAQGRAYATKAGIIILHPTASGALTMNGGGTVTVVGVPIIIDSNAPDAGLAKGGGTASAPEFHIVGVPGTSGSGYWNGTIKNGQQPVPDPLAYLPEPNPNSMYLISKNATHYAGNSNKTVKIEPGIYQGGISVSGQVSLQMAPGIYYMEGGGFSFTGQGNLEASGVMIVNAHRPIPM